MLNIIYLKKNYSYVEFHTRKILMCRILHTLPTKVDAHDKDHHIIVGVYSSLTRIINYRSANDVFKYHGNKNHNLIYKSYIQKSDSALATKFITVAVSSETDALYVRPASLFP